MLERIVRGSALALVAGIALAGCSSLSKNGRQQAAQQKYLRRIRETRLTEQKRIIADKNRALAVPMAPSGWSTNVTLDPAESPASSPTETAAPENPPANP